MSPQNHRPDETGDRPDHRRIGRELNLFAASELLGAGLPLWLPRGTAIRDALERYIVDEERRAGWQHVHTPSLAKQALYERSCHWQHYRDDMFPPMTLGDGQNGEHDAEQVVLRPMNCPHHALVYAAEQRSWRNLPLRIAELGDMYRNERSGVVAGLGRVRAMTLNDGHVFCAVEHLEAELAGVVAMIRRAYRTLGIEAARWRLSLPGAGKTRYIDDPMMWARAERHLRDALEGCGVDFEPAPGEAAFYGPKLDVQVRDAHGREETLSTAQVDFHLPGRFGLSYIGDSAHQPVMIHRAVLSTMERMVAHLLEAHAGVLPAWLSPVQVALLPVNPESAVHLRHCQAVRQRLVEAGLRPEIDDADKTLAARVRLAQQGRTPYLAIIGDHEAARDSAALRLRDGRRLPPMPVQELVGMVGQIVRTRSQQLLPAA